MPREAPKVIANRYQVMDQLGAGAMGAVFRTTDRLTGSVVALKQITLETKNLQFASRGGMTVLKPCGWPSPPSSKTWPPCAILTSSA
jgi:serine/threonine protein kinase